MRCQVGQHGAPLAGGDLLVAGVGGAEHMRVYRHAIARIDHCGQPRVHDKQTHVGRCHDEPQHEQDHGVFPGSARGQQVPQHQPERDDADLARRKPGELSGGQQQRIALARAIVAKPDFLLLDEPFAGLDLLTRDYILDHIRNLTDTVGYAVVLVTHDPADAARLCSHAIALENARVIEHSELSALLQQRSVTVAQAFPAAPAPPIAIRTHNLLGPLTPYQGTASMLR
ncbi:MAG: ATP-binding cassette domain-containing protein [Phycisphaera sp.]|nr:ATP-binding cassette domain-containing protein [Phycisphaera sp.]